MEYKYLNLTSDYDRFPSRYFPVVLLISSQRSRGRDATNAADERHKRETVSDSVSGFILV